MQVEHSQKTMSSGDIRRSASPDCSEVRVAIATRGSMSLVGAGRWATDCRPGNLGMSLGILAEVVVRVTSRRDRIEAASVGTRMTIHHVVHRFRTAVDSGCSFNVALLTCPPKGVGLASHSAAQSAVLIALNRLYGTPFSDEELIAMQVDAYTEEEGSGIVAGFSTGLTMALALNPGVGLLHEGGKLAVHVTPQDWTASVYLPRGTIEPALVTQERVIAARATDADVKDFREKDALVRGLVTPAILDADLPSLGSAVFALQELGSKRVEILGRNRSIFQVLRDVRAAGSQCAFMSSLGPAIIDVAEGRPKLKVRAALAEHGFGLFSSGAVPVRRGMIAVR